MTAESPLSLDAAMRRAEADGTDLSTALRTARDVFVAVENELRAARLGTYGAVLLPSGKELAWEAEKRLVVRIPNCAGTSQPVVNASVQERVEAMHALAALVTLLCVKAEERLAAVRTATAEARAVLTVLKGRP